MGIAGVPCPIGTTRWRDYILPAWYSLAWRYRIRITADHTLVGSGGVTGFASYFSLGDIPAEHPFWTHVAADGRDIRVALADGVTEVPREVVAISTAGHTGELHFKGDLSDSADTSFWLYYGSPTAAEPAAAATNGKYAVWTDRLATWHLTGLADSCAGQNTLTGTVNHVAGKVGDALHVDWVNPATGDDIAGLHSAAAFSLAFWARRHVLNINETFVSKWLYSTNGCFAIQCGQTIGSGLTIFVATALNDNGSGCRVDSGADVFSVDTWRRIVVVFDGSQTGDANRLKAFADGELISLTTVAGAVPAALTASDSDVSLGSFPGLGRILNGEVDEASIFSTVLGQAWIDTDFNNQNDPAAFWTVGAEELR